MAASDEFVKSNHERLCFSVPEAAKMLGISRGLAYELTHSGQLPAIRLGHRILVPKKALEKMMEQLLGATPCENSQYNKTT